LTGGRRRWLFALGATVAAALLSVGGVALAGSLLSSPPAPQFDTVNQADVVAQTNVSTPADDQYGNPLEGKLCADPAELDLAPPRVGDSVESEFKIVNCGDVPVSISPLQQSNEDSPFHPAHEDSRPQCPISTNDQLPPLDPGDFCVLFVIFPGIPSRPPGDYSDTWTFAGDNASVTVQLRGTVPPHTPGDEQYGNPLIGKLCASPTELNIPAPADDEAVRIDNCSDATITLSPLQKSDEGSPFFPLRLPELSNECPFGTDPARTLAPRERCVLYIGFPASPSTPPGDYSDTWTFPGDKASVTVHLLGTVRTFVVSAFNAPDLSSPCAAGPVDTGVDLASGQEAVITAYGSATWSQSSMSPNGPDGDPAGPGYYVPGGPIAALIGRVGAGNWMEIGSGRTTVVGPGTLQLAFDDAVSLCDNGGGFTVTVLAQQGP
jgi:hypothetical protein